MICLDKESLPCQKKVFVALAKKREIQITTCCPDDMEDCWGQYMPFASIC